MIHTLCWNARGANNTEPMTGSHNVPEFARKVGFKNFLHGDDTNPKIWILWKDHVKVSHIATGDQYITISASTLASSPITVTFVYAAISQARRLLLWDQLENFARTLAGPWIVAGNFNVISSGNEKKGGARAWHEHADFLPLVEAEWPKHTHANPILAIALKLKGLRRRLKSWNGSVFGNLKVKIKGLTAIIDALEADLQNRWSYNVEGEIARSKELLASTQRLHYQVLADKAKARWVANGDRNTTLFHALIKVRRAKNRVRLHMPDGTFTEDSNIIGHLAQEHFNHIMGGFSIRPPEDAFNDVLPMINDDDNEILTTVPGTEEIHGAIRSLNPSSAPGPDGFIGHFFSHCWHIIKDDLARSVGAFFRAGVLQVNHLLYADDILIFSNGSKPSIERLLSLINRFCTNSGQQLNPSKSIIFFDENIPEDRRLTILQATNFTPGIFPTTYLGAPLFPGQVKIAYFQNVEDKIRARIGGWIGNLISMGGKLIIIESILNSLLTHILAALPTPVTVINRINSMFASFLWDNNEQKRRHWINWSDVCRPKEAGGLGIRNLTDIRRAHHYKLTWRCMHSTELWGRYVRSRYTLQLTGSHMWTYLKKVIPDLNKQARWQVGVGQITCLDFCWLYDVHPPSSLKWIPLCTLLLDPSFRQQLVGILPDHGKQELEKINISNQKDRLIWECNMDGNFSTKAFYSVVASPKVYNARLDGIWHPWLPPRISAFLWWLFHGAIATDDKIQGCGISLASQCRCCSTPS
ncbi:hypothetical protein QQ045_003063 [Rhodiola kirilowii]